MRPALAIALMGASLAAGPGVGLPAGFSLAAEGGLSASYDDNALLGRRGQFLDAGSAGGDDRRTDLGLGPFARIELLRPLGAQSEVRLVGEGAWSAWRSVPELESYDLGSGVQLSARPGEAVDVLAGVRLRYHRDRPEWSSRLVEPVLGLRHVFWFGLIGDLRYRWTDQQYARKPGGAAEPKNSYANVDTGSHAAELDLRLWHGARVRTDLVASAHVTRYAGNLGRNLEDYARLDAGTERSDRGAGLTATVTVLPGSELLVGPGVRFERNDSNSEPFTFRAAHALLGALWEPRPGHTAYLELDYGRFDFPEERFDRRFENTRRDFRRAGKAAYRYRHDAGWAVELALAHDGSVSNDCERFSPLRDELGLPVYSRSYSCFDRNRADLTLSFELGRSAS